MEIVGATGLSGFMAVIVDVAYSRSKLALRTIIRNLNLKSQLSIFYSFRYISVYIYDFLKFVGVKVGVANFFLGQSIGIDETNSGRCTLTKQTCAQVSPNPNFCCFRDLSVDTDGRTDRRSWLDRIG